MGQATGYTCDYRPCSKFEAAETTGNGTPRLPDGWIKLHPAGGGILDLCSDRCLADVAIERYEAEAGKRFVRRSVPTESGVKREQRPRRVHTDDFKIEVVAAVDSGMSVAEAAAKYDVGEALVRGWIKAASS